MGETVVAKGELKALVECNVTWDFSNSYLAGKETLTPLLFTPNHSSEKIWWGESDDGISATTALALKAGIKTMLKPHLWVRKGWPGDIVMKSDTSSATLV
ncbi:MAG: hypothetical protein U5K54_14085 [Cytophagales bacterium]|nr:hypothetical protein [Cytophagales bacterium]